MFCHWLLGRDFLLAITNKLLLHLNTVAHTTKLRAKERMLTFFFFAFLSFASLWKHHIDTSCAFLKTPENISVLRSNFFQVGFLSIIGINILGKLAQCISQWMNYLVCIKRFWGPKTSLEVKCGPRWTLRILVCFILSLHSSWGRKTLKKYGCVFSK